MEQLMNEKSLNKVMFNVTKPKRYTNKYPLIYSCGDNKFICHEGIFTSEHWAVLDVIGSCINHCKYSGIGTLNKNYSSSKNIFIKGGECRYTTIDFHTIPTNLHNSSVKDISKGVNYKSLVTLKNISMTSDIINPSHYIGATATLRGPILFCFDSTHLKLCSDGLKKYPAKKIDVLINELSQLKVSLMYNVSYYNPERRKYCYDKFLIENPSSFFRILKTEEVNSKTGTIHTFYYIFFDTILGYLYVQNILSCNSNFIESHFYSMSKESQLIFKQIILTTNINHSNSKSLINTSYEKINARLNLKLYTHNLLKNRIDSALNELIENKFIHSYKEVEKGSIEIIGVNKYNENVYNDISDSTSFDLKGVTF